MMEFFRLPGQSLFFMTGTSMVKQEDKVVQAAMHQQPLGEHQQHPQTRGPCYCRPNNLPDSWYSFSKKIRNGDLLPTSSVSMAESVVGVHVEHYFG